jgi:hypothetical protein
MYGLKKINFQYNSLILPIFENYYFICNKLQTNTKIFLSIIFNFLIDNYSSFDKL